MFKKILLIFTLLTLIGCNASKPVIVTKKSASPKPKKEVVHSVKKINNSKSESKKSNSEVIVSTSKTTVTNDVISNYIAQFKDIAKSNMKNYGIPASIILAQGILESGAGKGDLAARSNNHFGIKCHKGWTGESVRHDDDAAQECFRKYNDPSESYEDHAVFLTGRNRYATLFALEKGDYKAWARGLRAAGYATDPKYPEKLISYIERYNLNQYDAEVLNVNYTPIKKQPIVIASIEPQDKNLYEVQKGDTFYSISKKFNLMVDELKQINNLSENILSIGQKIKVRSEVRN
jgi:flagellum-specific peptidoglycan hydrolase FlgJ